MSSAKERVRVTACTLRHVVLVVAALFSRGAVAQVPVVEPKPASAGESRALTAQDYARAERFLHANKDRYLVNADVAPHWIREGNQERLWFRLADEGGGHRFLIIDPRSAEQRPAFDHTALARVIGAALGKPVDPEKLPFQSFRFVTDSTVGTASSGGAAIEFLLENELWGCNSKECTRAPRPKAASTSQVVSPDGRWAVYLQGNNLWLRATDGSVDTALTTDGELNHAYAGSTGNNLSPVRRQSLGSQATPVVLWSPDSRRVLTHQVDERKVGDLALVQSTPPDGQSRPKLFTYKYSMLNDEHQALIEPVVIDVTSRALTRLQTDPIATPFVTLIEQRRMWWSEDSERVFYVVEGRFARTMTLFEAQADSGSVREVIREESSRYLQIGDVAQPPVVRTLLSGDVIWFSERDGWGHLYRYSGATGKLRNRITSGAWGVRSIVRVDEKRGWIYFLANGREPGRDPYLRALYRVRPDGSGLKLLTPELGEHELATMAEARGQLAQNPLARESELLAFSPSGEHFVHAWSRPDAPPVTALRRADGTLVEVLARADIPKLRAEGVSLPETFRAVAADGRTPLYGILFRPSTFKPGVRYPVVDSIYPGPQINRAWRSFIRSAFDPLEAQAIAELGFVVVSIDGRGTPLRSREFLDNSYGKLSTAGNLDDHIAVLRQLAARNPWMDLDRVGVYGQSGGAFAATRAVLAHPEFYKVAVAASGNHDQRGYLAIWGETYLGPDDGHNYADAANAALAANLKGKLLLIHGEMDDNVHPAHTLRLVDALIRANKDFELLIVPNATHLIMNAYPRRRQWDFLVRNLMGVEPPAGYTMQTP